MIIVVVQDKNIPQNIFKIHSISSLQPHGYQVLDPFGQNHSTT